MNQSEAKIKEHKDDLGWSEIQLGFAKLLLSELMKDENFCNSTNEKKVAILDDAVKQETPLK